MIRSLNKALTVFISIVLCVLPNWHIAFTQDDPNTKKTNEVFIPILMNNSMSVRSTVLNDESTSKSILAANVSENQSWCDLGQEPNSTWLPYPDGPFASGESPFTVTLNWNGFYVGWRTDEERQQASESGWDYLILKWGDGFEEILIPVEETCFYAPGAYTYTKRTWPPFTREHIYRCKYSNEGALITPDQMKANVTRAFGAPGVDTPGKSVILTNCPRTGTPGGTFPPLPGGEANTPPLVNAGSSPIVGNSSTEISLLGTVTDDGLPTSAVLTTGWSVVSGPGSVMFSNPVLPSTTATFGNPGTYILRLTASDSQLSAFSDVRVQIVDHYRVEFKAWIPHQSVVDPLMITKFEARSIVTPLMKNPLKDCIAAAADTKTIPPINIESSQFLGDNHVDYGKININNSAEKDYRILNWVEFDFDGQQISNFYGDGDFGITSRSVLVKGPSGKQLRCIQQEVALREFLPVSQLLSNNTFKMAVAGFDPLTPRDGASLDELSQVLACASMPSELFPACFGLLRNNIPLTPAINGEFTATIEQNGEISLEYITDFFPSYGIAVQRNGFYWMDNVIHDASCVNTKGYEGAANLLVRLQTKATIDRHWGTLIRGATNRTCVPTIYPEVVTFTERLLRLQVTPANEPVYLILASRLSLTR